MSPSSFLRRAARSLLLPLVFAGSATTQAPTYSVATTAEADTSATEPGGFLLSIPGIGDDFVLFGDGQMVTRANGTARISAFVHRLAAFDREFYVQLEFSGRIGPGDVGYPPAGSPVLTLQAGAYLPSGSIDPATYVYYTQVTGTLTGVRAYAGASLTVTNQGAAQLGLGASNKNVLPGLAVDLAVTVVQQPILGSMTPLGPAQMRATLVTDMPFCATHCDADAAVSSGPVRTCLQIPGLGSDFLFLPTGEFVEGAAGTATLTGIVRRQSDHTDEWALSLTLSGRVDPGSPAHPPAGSPVQQLLPAAYASQGGPVDPQAWHYYTQATGTLTGAGNNAGGLIPLQQQGAVQVGLGAAHANLFCGLAAELVAGPITQPTSHTILVTGNLQLQTNVAVRCLVPLPQVLTGIVQSLPTVTEQKAIYTGIDLGWTVVAAVGPNQLDADQREWVGGHIRVVDHDTVELSIPQGLAPGSYPVRLFTVGGISNALTLNLTAPTTITLRTEDTRTTGEDQHWVVHQGTLPSFAFSFLMLSPSNVATPVPGIVMLDIGDLGNSLILFGGALHDTITGAATITLSNLQPGLAGLRFYAQAAVLDATNPNTFPLLSSDVWFTDYQ